MSHAFALPATCTAVEGVLIQRLRPGSVAHAAGLQSGMIVTEVMGEAVHTAAEFALALLRCDARAGVQIRVFERGVPRTLLMQLPLH